MLFFLTFIEKGKDFVVFILYFLFLISLCFQSFMVYAEISPFFPLNIHLKKCS